MKRKPASKVSGAQSIHRAAQILRNIASYSIYGLRVVDIAAHLGLERPTVHRILQCLAAENLVMQDPASRRYFLGHGIFELGLTAAPQFKLRDLCRTSLERLAKQTHGVAFLTIRNEFDAISIDCVTGGHHRVNIPKTLEIGVHRPLGVGAGSLALLMALPDSEIETIITANSKRLTAFGRLNVPTLRQIVKNAQEVGYAVHDNRLMPGICGVGLLIRNNMGIPLGAISVSLFCDSITPELAQEVLQQTGKEVRAIQNLLHKANKDVVAIPEYKADKLLIL